jgi:endonuclease YncB( thermonuclease family)
MRKSVIAILLVVALAGPVDDWQERSCPAVITKAVDGDTVLAMISFGGWKMRHEKIRLLAIDAPERGEPGYDEATKFLTDLVLNQRATVILKENAEGQIKCGFYGRVLARIEIHGWDVSELMLEQGLVKKYSRKNNRLLLEVR